MTLYFPLLDQPLVFRENAFQVLIIEDPVALRKFLEELSSQIAGCTGSIVVGEKNAPLEISHAVALVTDPFHPNMESRKLSGRILQLAARAAEDHEGSLHMIMSEINALAAELSMEMDFEAAFRTLEDPVELLKLMDFHLDSDNLELPELLLEWMRLQRLFFGKQLFVMYGLKACLSEDELMSFYRSVSYEKINLLLLEAFQRGDALPGEELTIIDKDLCVIS